MSKITQMAGTPQSLCRAWHALHTLERGRTSDSQQPSGQSRPLTGGRLRRGADNNT